MEIYWIFDIGSKCPQCGFWKSWTHKDTSKFIPFPLSVTMVICATSKKKECWILFSFEIAPSKNFLCNSFSFLSLLWSCDCQTGHASLGGGAWLYILCGAYIQRKLPILLATLVFYWQAKTRCFKGLSDLLCERNRSVLKHLITLNLSY
jgi:hypothetical protein